MDNPATAEDRRAAIRAHNARVTGLSLSAWLSTAAFLLGVALDFNEPMSVTAVGALVAVAAGANVGTFARFVVYKAMRRGSGKGAS